MVRRTLLIVLGLTAVLLLLNGCGSEAATESAAPASTEVASSETTTVASTETSVSTSEGGSEVGFSTDVLPILENVCTQCHSPGGPGSTHWDLQSAADAAEFADFMASVTSTGFMPPWPASELSVPFLNDLSLTDDEIEAISSWAENGAPLDVAPATPVRTLNPPQFIDDPDLVLTSARGGYTGSTDVLDDYRCLVFDPEFTDTEWILASHFEPDQVEVVHHAIVTLHSAEVRARAEQLDAAEPGPGWTCYVTSLLEGVDGGGVPLNGWAPGQPPRRLPDGYGIPVDPGDFLVVQIHYHFDESAPTDLSRMTFDLASEVELAAAGSELKRLTGDLYLGPAEIPCYEGDTDPLCDRNTALDRVEELYGGLARRIPDLMLWQCGARVEDYADMTNGTAWSTCEHEVSNPGRIVSVMAHMHELGLRYRMTKNPGRADETVLLDIPDWDFDWQFLYQPVDEIILDDDDTVLIECAWNRERAPFDAVGYILWAEGTVDEMCYSSIVTAPR